MRSIRDKKPSAIGADVCLWFGGAAGQQRCLAALLGRLCLNTSTRWSCIPRCRHAAFELRPPQPAAPSPRHIARVVVHTGIDPSNSCILNINLPSSEKV